MPWPYRYHGSHCALETCPCVFPDVVVWISLKRGLGLGQPFAGGPVPVKRACQDILLRTFLAVNGLATGQLL